MSEYYRIELIDYQEFDAPLPVNVLTKNYAT